MYCGHPIRPLTKRHPLITNLSLKSTQPLISNKNETTEVLQLFFYRKNNNNKIKATPKT
jgi:hypothetical protein